MLRPLSRLPGASVCRRPPRRLTDDGRIRACVTDANPNCAGTANRNEVGRVHEAQPGCQMGTARALPWLPAGATPRLLPTCAPHAPASHAPQTYMPAWEAPQGSPADAMREFEAALRQVAPEARVVEAASGPASEFRRFQVSDPLFDHDDIE